MGYETFRYSHRVLTSEAIEIKRENRGKFTDYCKSRGYSGVTQDCIKEGKRSPNRITRKRAIFAENSRRWKDSK